MCNISAEGVIEEELIQRHQQLNTRLEPLRAENDEVSPEFFLSTIHPTELLTYVDCIEMLGIFYTCWSADLV